MPKPNHEAPLVRYKQPTPSTFLCMQRMLCQYKYNKIIERSKDGGKIGTPYAFAFTSSHTSFANFSKPGSRAPIKSSTVFSFNAGIS